MQRSQRWRELQGLIGLRIIDHFLGLTKTNQSKEKEEEAQLTEIAGGVKI